MKVFQLNECDWWMAPTLDAAIVIALIGFVGTVAYATYIERGRQE